MRRQRRPRAGRWITHDCLAWNYSISSPSQSQELPLGAGRARSLRFHLIMHPASSSQPSLPLLLLFSCAWLHPCRLFSHRESPVAARLARSIVNLDGDRLFVSAAFDWGTTFVIVWTTRGRAEQLVGPSISGLEPMTIGFASIDTE